MARIDITKLSSKGQVVIPLEMRKNLKEGDKLIVIENGDQIILKKADKFDENLKEDLDFARRTNEAWKSYEKGEFRTMEYEDFLKEVRAELKKVTWPTRNETISSTYLVLLMVFAVSAYLGAVDSILAWLVKRVLN